MKMRISSIIVIFVNTFACHISISKIRSQDASSLIRSSPYISTSNDADSNILFGVEPRFVVGGHH